MIALQLYSIRDELQDPDTLPRTLSQLFEVGYRAVEVAGLGPKTRPKFGVALANAGLVACGVHVSYDDLQASVPGVAAECHELGCGYVVVPGLPDDLRTLDGFRRFAAEAADLARGLRRHGIQLVYHNHSYELERFGSETALEILLSSVSPRDLQVELDTYWLQYGGANPSTWIRRHGGRVPLVHCKDMAVDRGQPLQTEVGAGNLDWPDILAACRDAGTKWLVVEQDESPRGSIESATISYQNLFGLTRRLGWDGDADATPRSQWRSRSRSVPSQ